MDGTHSAKVLQIRVADTGDAPEIAICLEAAFAPYRDLYSSEAYADTVANTDGILRRIADMHVLVAVEGNRVAGTIAGAHNQRREGHLRGMAVLPQRQGLGIAGQLLIGIEDYLRAQRCSRITLDTTLPLRRAIRFYERRGYRHTGVIGDFFGMPLYEYAKDL